MPPGAGDNVTTMLPRPERGLRGLRRLCGPGDQFRALARQFGPAAVEIHVVTDLNPEFAKVAVEDRQRVAGSRAVLHGFALERNDEMDFAVGSHHFALAPDQDSGIRAQFFFFRIEQVGGNHDIASVLARLSSEHLLHLPFERNRTRQRVALCFAGDRRFREHREVEAAIVFRFGLRGHLVHDSRQLLEALVEAGVLAPKRLHNCADDHLAGRAIGGGVDPRPAVCGRRRGGSQSRQTAHTSQKCSSVHLLVSFDCGSGTPL